MMNFAGALGNGILTVHRGAFALAPWPIPWVSRL